MNRFVAWLERNWDILLAVAIGVILVVVMSVLKDAEDRETETLLSEGCEIVSTRQNVYWSQTDHPPIRIFQSYSTDTWSCPDGRKFDR